MPSTDWSLAALLPELSPSSSLEIQAIASDSRQVAPGTLFFGLQTAHGDGSNFLQDAWAAGARAAVVEAQQPGYREDAGRPIWFRRDARELLGWALRRRAQWVPENDPLLIGVTGTNGKSSVTRLLAQLAPAPSEVIGTLGYGPVDALQPLANTTPAAVELWPLLLGARARGVKTVALEVSSHALALGRVAAVPFRVAVFTNLSQDHLDFHGSLENYGAAKARLFQTPELEWAILNADDPFSAKIHSLLAPGVRVLTYGFSAGEYRVREFHPGASGSLLEVQTPQGIRRVRSPLLGRVNAYNLLAAWACAAALGWEGVERRMVDLSPPPGRYQRLPQRPGKPQVMVDYAHTPDALAQVLRDLRSIAKGRITVVFGCGGERDRGKRPQMGAIAHGLADRIILTNDNPRGEDPLAIIAEIRAGIPGDVPVELDRRRAIARAIAEAGPGDWVLIAGKGHENYQDQAGQRIAFADAQVALEELAG